MAWWSNYVALFRHDTTNTRVQFEASNLTVCSNYVTWLWHNASSMIVNCEWPRFGPNFPTRPEKDRPSQKVGPKIACSQNHVFRPRSKCDADAGLRSHSNRWCTCFEPTRIVTSCGLCSGMVRVLCLSSAQALIRAAPRMHTYRAGWWYWNSMGTQGGTHASHVASVCHKILYNSSGTHEGMDTCVACSGPS